MTKTKKKGFSSKEKLQKKKEDRAKKEGLMTKIGIVTIILAAVVCLGIIAGFVINEAAKTSSDPDSKRIIGEWYEVNGSACWVFGKDTVRLYYPAESGEDAPTYRLESERQYALDEKEKSLSLATDSNGVSVLSYGFDGEDLLICKGGTTLTFSRKDVSKTKNEKTD